MSDQRGALRQQNLLLAVTTATALGLLIVVATVFGAPQPPWRYAAAGVLTLAAYLALNALWRRRRPRARPPLIDPASPFTTVMSAFLPLVILLFAGAVLIFPNLDYGLPIIIGAVWLGLTIESAIASRRG